MSEYQHEHPVRQRHLILSMVLTVLFVIGEAIAGYFAHSLALLSDAGHNLADAAALGLTLYGVWSARKPATAQRTFGSHRIGILAALGNAVMLVVIAFFVFFEAVRRFSSPPPVQSGVMIVVAIVALILNALISIWLRAGAEHDLNTRSAYLHMMGDMLSSIGVIIAGVVIALTGSPLADPLVSCLIGIVILWSSWDILTETLNILLEAAPKGLNVADVENRIKKIPGVLNVHDLHVWTVASEMIACSCHILVSAERIDQGQRIVKNAEDMMEKDFAIGHTTIQIETAPDACDPDDIHCQMIKNVRTAKHAH